MLRDWFGPFTHRLAELLPDGRLVEITGSYTVVPLDQPQQLAKCDTRVRHQYGGEAALS
jgi:hypothetical protein